MAAKPKTASVRKPAKTVKSAKRTAAKAVKAPKGTKPAAARMSLAEVMTALEKAGSAQTKKTYARHGVPEPMFGVSFATLKAMLKQIGVDHELAMGLWDTGNYDARNLAFKVADPAKMTTATLDRWASVPIARMSVGYLASLTVDGPHARSRSEKWLAAKDETTRCCGWQLVAAMATRDESVPDPWFAARVAEIETSIHAAPNWERDSMIRALIQIGCRSAALRKRATAAAKKIGKIEIDYGDTACAQPTVVPTLEKTWAHSTSKGFDTPAAHERTRQSMRLRC